MSVIKPYLSPVYVGGPSRLRNEWTTSGGPFPERRRLPRRRRQDGIGAGEHLGWRSPDRVGVCKSLHCDGQAPANDAREGEPGRRHATLQP